jgi:DNA (cytosine-5)-methyltransferase 1
VRALDLFCCTGGATVGLQRAGFVVHGVDVRAMPRYPGDTFERADALGVSLVGYDFVWASPPCQAFTAYRRRGYATTPQLALLDAGERAPNLIPTVRAKLRAAGIPYVIENVEGAPLEGAAMLCGSMFGLDVKRHRFFEASFPLTPPPCDHDRFGPPRFPCAGNRTNPRRTVEIGVRRIPLDVQKRAMGVDWEIEREELSQAIPPAYSEWIGRAFLAWRERNNP